MTSQDDLNAEAKAFDERIEERVKAGFIPDIRRAIKCEYFYKSFYRDPYFIKLYLGEQISYLLNMLQKYGRKGSRILEVGCGPGHVSLELARSGYYVVGIDISQKAIEVAKRTLESNPFKENFGSLEYKVLPFEKIDGVYDVILFSGVIHHMIDPDRVISKALNLLQPNGLLLCLEPCHEKWRVEDAAQIALIRGLLSLTGFWYEEDLGSDLYSNREKFETYVDDIHTEYVTERDKHEIGGQSPNDNVSTGEEILASLRKYLVELEYKGGTSFIYRLLGGLRGPDKTIYKIASFLAQYDKLCVERGFMNPNDFFFAGRKK